MTFILAKKTDSFFYPVNLPIVTDTGASQIARFEFRFKRVSRSQLNALQKAHETTTDLDVDSLERDINYVLDIADGWKDVNSPDGTPVEFIRATVAALLDDYPNAASEIVKAFFEATHGGGRKAKN